MTPCICKQMWSNDFFHQSKFCSKYCNSYTDMNAMVCFIQFRPDVEIVVHPGILVPRRILSWQKDLAQFLWACPEIKRIPECKK